ncbi:hypothetical protein OSB04_un000336 [Centaurea solstitialis]|uniref:Reverse transcriptase domain-containing protein n=1 Tax=Centaurea solstitialis TaxID=347529 RepID=A0AA38S6G5_9ASTR|nr:hypothetical protein OSB04_un000336 [Centaurea solstitialis]
MRFFDWFWEEESISGGCNASFLTLILKSRNPFGLNDFRPICLIVILYKILSKVLAERMKRVIRGVISYEQSAFLKVRSILDGVLIANEVRKGAILKVDFEKAYGSVGWSFLLEALEKMRLGEKWRKWISVCLCSSSISVLANGSLTEEFSLGRGLRQGDPLAPFLFLVEAECLHLMIEKAKNLGLLNGVKVGKKDVLISHLQYADKVILFGSWETENLKNMKKVMECFYEVSGLNMNLNKSKLYGIGVQDEEVKNWAMALGCGTGKLPFNYLGLPTGSSMHSSSSWTPVIEKTKKKLARWKAKLFSFGGWGVGRELKRIGERGISLGQMGQSSLKILNWCLLCKWWWRFLVEEGALLVKRFFKKQQIVQGQDNRASGRVDRGSADATFEKIDFGLSLQSHARHVKLVTPGFLIKG